MFSDFLTPSPLVTVTNQLIVFLSSAIWGHPLPPTYCGRHIWKPLYLRRRAMMEPAFLDVDTLAANNARKSRGGGGFLASCRALTAMLSLAYTGLLTDP